jgi:hypothetical protein
MMAVSAVAQDQPKVKVNDNEVKIKSDDEKVKLQKEENKYKTDGLKVKDNENELKVKGDGLKIKDNENERKVKATVAPMRPTSTERVEMKTGATQVKSTEHVAPLPQERVTIERADPMPVAVQPVTVSKSTDVKKSSTHKRVAAKSTTPKRVAARKSTAPKTIVRTKLVRDTVTVYVPGPTERVVSTQTEYVHDTVTVTRVDTVVRMQTNNTYSGYSVPRGDFKKVKLKKDKDGEVHMKRKE